MLFRRDVAKHGRAMPADHRGSNRAGDVVVAGSDVRDERAKRVERRFVAPFHFLVDLLLNFVHGNVAGAFNHDLDIVLPGFFCEFAKDFQFSELRFVARVGNRTRPQSIPK